MASRRTHLDSRIAALAEALGNLGAPAASVQGAIARWQGDAAALRFHLNRDPSSNPPIVAILGGTGTGKSTLVNRLLETEVSATSFKRTFTAGPVATVGKTEQLPGDWLGVSHRVVTKEELPAKGEPDSLVVAVSDASIADRITIVDTPDLDGDQPVHHVQADRVFRWADAVLFLVTPEKYQMTELPPYYRLARRYGIPAAFAMNKCEQTEALQDYAKQLESDGWKDLKLFAIPRDDAAWAAPEKMDLTALRHAIAATKAEPSDEGLSYRVTDLLGRLSDQITGPLRHDRKEADRLIAVLKSMEAAEPGVDVHPMTLQLQRRMQQRSVLYLMGPGRILQRARQVPGMLVRLPRTLWDTVVRGKTVTINAPDQPSEEAKVPDFRATLIDQFTVLQSRIDDAMRGGPITEGWLKQRSESYAAWRIDPNESGKIADEELAKLRDWLEKRWNSTPRDTALLLRLLRKLPGGEKIVHGIEATPYLVAIILGAQHVLSHGVDLMILGGYSMATWLGEKLSNEVTSHVRETNQRIGERFGQLAHEQIQKACEWLAAQAPTSEALDQINAMAEKIAEDSTPLAPGTPGERGGG